MMWGLTKEEEESVLLLQKLAGGYDELMDICKEIAGRTGETATALQVLEYIAERNPDLKQALEA